MKAVIAWTLALLITLATAYFQRKTGPSYPKEVHAVLDGEDHEFQLPRSQVVNATGCEIRIPVADTAVQGKVLFKRYPTADAFDTIQMSHVGNELIAILPPQPAAGKLLYLVKLTQKGRPVPLHSPNAVVVRYRGDVPAWVMIPHIAFMFLAMLFANLAGLKAIFRDNRMKLYTYLTAGLMVLGGFIFGPIMQKFAFGEYWTGFPYGWDLTDNKVLIAMVFWIIALLLNVKKTRPVWIIIAAVLTLIVYCIPHSLFGSELDYATGVVTTG